MPHYRRLNNANAVKRMTDFLGHSDNLIRSWGQVSPVTLTSKRKNRYHPLVAIFYVPILHTIFARAKFQNL